MPKHVKLIRCPDGYDYSTLDTSPYAVWCQNYVDSVAAAKQQQCMANPACRDGVLQGQRDRENSFVGGMAIIIIMFLVFIVVAQSNKI